MVRMEEGDPSNSSGGGIEETNPKHFKDVSPVEGGLNSLLKFDFSFPQTSINRHL